jgi:chromosome partitioning protein
MIITVASLKGGQAKTTSAVHIAALMQADAKTLLVDGDPNRSALNWHKRKGFPFEVCDERQAVKFSRDFTHIVFDTQARPSKEDLAVLAGGCDQLVIPLTPDALSLDTLFVFTDSLKELGATQFKVLLTIVPPKPARDGADVRQTLEHAGLPVFRTDIRRYKAFQKAALAGVLVKDIADEYAAAAWADYAAVADEIMAKVERRVEV